VRYGIVSENRDFSEDQLFSLKVYSAFIRFQCCFFIEVLIVFAMYRMKREKDLRREYVKKRLVRRVNEVCSITRTLTARELS